MKNFKHYFSFAGFFSTICFLNAAPPENYSLLYADEFDGKTPFTNEWVHRTGARFGGLNLPENVRLDKGDLVIDFRKEKIDGKDTYTCGGVISKNIFGYGYYETRSKVFGKGPGLHSSFWNMGVNGDGVRTPKQNQIIEIDGYEVDSHEPKAIKPNVHYYVGSHTSTGTVSGSIPLDAPDASQEYFIQGFEWLPNKIRWFVNGKLVREIPNPKFYGPQQFWFTALATPEWGKPDDTTLPGETRWDYFRFYGRALPGVNRVANGDFEYNASSIHEKSFVRNLQEPVGWCEEGDVHASVIQASAQAFRGESVLRHFSNASYKVATYQRHDFVVNGTYQLTAYVRSSSTQASVRIYDDTGREERLAIPATPGKKWEKIVIEKFVVTSKQVVVGFSSEAKAGDWLEVDGVELVQTDGGDPTPFKIIAGLKSQTLPGEVIVDNDMPGYQETGVWEKSGMPGWNTTKTRWSKTGGSTATWTPDLPISGRYTVSIFNIVNPGSSPDAKIQISGAGEPVEAKLNQDSGESGWKELGTFSFPSGKKSFIRIGPASDANYLRADAVRFVPEYARKLSSLSAFSVGSKMMLVNGTQERIDPLDPETALELSNKKLILPLTALARILNADLYQDPTQKTATLFGNGIKLTLNAGKNTAVIEGKEKSLSGPLSIRQNTFFGPVEDIAAAFGKRVFRHANGLVLIGDGKSVFDEKSEAADLAEILKLLR